MTMVLLPVTGLQEYGIIATAVAVIAQQLEHFEDIEPIVPRGLMVGQQQGFQQSFILTGFRAGLFKPVGRSAPTLSLPI